MDTWKGEKLHGADRRLTRAQLEAADCVRPLSKQKVAANAAVVLGRLYMATNGRGRHWQKAVTALAGVIVR
jgi:hypothetical protein